ncbi:alpha/beta fold hydrolase, partial [Enhygromyxa salina]|uniref:alpha/beta fold hydrolase n=1 Tax=Enhygromyxa salina TaxID=215803 RepID=UPI0015E6EADB
MSAPTNRLRRMLQPSLLRAPMRPGALLMQSAEAMLELAGAFNVVRLGERGLNHKLERKGIRSQSVRLGDANVRYFEGGEGPPVVLLHGFGASAVWQWHEQIAPLARNHRVIVPDLLWFGGSWSKRRDFSVDYQLEVVTALLDQLGIAEASFVGISYGGIIAHELAALHPERVQKLVILDSPGRSYTAQDHAQMLERFAVTDVGALLVPRTPEDVQTLLEVGYHKPPKTPRWVHGQVLRAMYGEFREEKVELLSSLLRELGELGGRPGKVRQETLLIWGEHDCVFPLEIGRRLQADLGGRAR